MASIIVTYIHQNPKTGKQDMKSISFGDDLIKHITDKIAQQTGDKDVQIAGALPFYKFNEHEENQRIVPNIAQVGN